MLTIFALQLLQGCSYIEKLANELTEDPYDIDVIYVDWTPRNFVLNGTDL